jgi:hypothetical protein
MLVTYMLQYYDKAILGQAALFGFMQSLDLIQVVSPGPPPVVSTVRFSQGITTFNSWLIKCQLSFIADIFWDVIPLLCYLNALKVDEFAASSFFSGE